MAKPDCCDGWLPYAHELDAALAVADFTKGARIVLREVFEQLFGPSKAKVATLSPTDIGAMVGMPKSNVARATKELVEASALRRNPDGTYRFNKNYATWERNGSRRLTAAEIRYCVDAPRRANSRPHSSPGADTAASGESVANGARSSAVNGPVPPCDPVINSDNRSKPTVTNTAPVSTPDRAADPVINSDNPSTGTGINRDNQAVIDPDNAAGVPVIYRDNARLSIEITPPYNPPVGRVLKNLEKHTACEDDPLEAEDPDYRNPDAAEPEATPLNTVADVKRTLIAAEKLFPMTTMGSMCSVWLTKHLADRVIEAMTITKDKSIDRPVQYIQGILNSPPRPRGNGNGYSPQPSTPSRRLATPSEADPAGHEEYRRKFKRPNGATT